MTQAQHSLSTLHVRPLSGHIGAEIEGLDLASMVLDNRDNEGFPRLSRYFCSTR